MSEDRHRRRTGRGRVDQRHMMADETYRRAYRIERGGDQ